MPSKRKQAANAKRKRPRKKIILFLVEGESECRALREPLECICDAFDEDAEVYVRHARIINRNTGKEEAGDITSRFGATPRTIKLLIDKAFLLPFFQETGLYTKDIAKIIQIVDLDGAFIPDSMVVQAEDDSIRINYGEELITTSNVERIQERNAQKRENLAYLVSAESIKSQHDRMKKEIPYSVYFFSANLDHYLHNDANLPSNQKIVKADDFALKCCYQPSFFYDLLTRDEEYTQCSYEESWSKIQEGCNSLKQHSNLGILLSKLELKQWD